MSFSFCGVELASNVFLAPMAGVTDRPFRTVALSLGCGLAFTEMVSAAGLAKGDRKTRSYLPGPEEAPRVGVQLFGSRPEFLRDAALMVNDLAVPCVDLNLGCPAKKIVRSGCGAALLREPAKVAAMLGAVCSASKKPVLVKIRAGWDEKSVNAAEIARIAEGCGAAAVTVHGRTARQAFAGKADWEVVREVAGAVRLPVIGNGDITRPEQVDAALRDYGCAAVMIGRGACGNPWIFREVRLLRRGAPPAPPAGAELARVMLWHYGMALEEFGPRNGVHIMRRHLLWYGRGRAGAADFRRRVATLVKPEDVRREIEAFTAPESGCPAPDR